MAYLRQPRPDYGLGAKLVRSPEYGLGAKLVQPGAKLVQSPSRFHIRGAGHHAGAWELRRVYVLQRDAHHMLSVFTSILGDI